MRGIVVLGAMVVSLLLSGSAAAQVRGWSSVEKSLWVDFWKSAAPDAFGAEKGWRCGSYDFSGPGPAELIEYIVNRTRDRRCELRHFGPERLVTTCTSKDGTAVGLYDPAWASKLGEVTIPGPKVALAFVYASSLEALDVRAVTGKPGGTLQIAFFSERAGKFVRIASTTAAFDATQPAIRAQIDLFKARWPDRKFKYRATVASSSNDTDHDGLREQLVISVRRSLRAEDGATLELPTTIRTMSWNPAKHVYED